MLPCRPVVRRDVHEAAVALLAHRRDRGAGHVERAPSDGRRAPSPVGVGELPDDAIAQDAPALLTATSISSAITPSNSVATAARATTVRPVKSKVMLTRVRRSARRWGTRDLARSTSERNQIAPQAFLVAHRAITVLFRELAVRRRPPAPPRGPTVGSPTDRSHTLPQHESESATRATPRDLLECDQPCW
jgi:hypothetical protein